jgi:regulator of replication initiation timing
MIQINNINFSQKTIESIQIDGDDVKGVEVELQNNNFKLTIIKNTNETIKEEINDINFIHKEAEEEEPKEEQPEPEEEPEPEEPDEPNEEIITLDKFKGILEAKVDKKNTCKTYYRTIRDLYKYFKSNDMMDLLSKEKEIIEHLEQEYKTTSTLKNKLCGIYKCYTLLNIESKLLKDKIEHYKITQTIIEDKSNHEDKKPIEEADKILDYFNNTMEQMDQCYHPKNQTKFSKWDTHKQLYCVLKIYLLYGVLRPSELIDVKITNTSDRYDDINYYNIWTNELIINKHKNDRQGPKVIVIKDEQLRRTLRQGLNGYLISNSKNKLYNDSSAFTKLFSKTFNNYTPYDLRKCISSKAIHEGDTEKIKMLEKNQGHSLETILLYYNTYT